MVSNKILSWAINLGLLSVLFVPLFISRSLFFPFITGKNFAFRIIVEIIFGLWIWLALRDPADGWQGAGRGAVARAAAAGRGWPAARGGSGSFR